MTSRIHVRKPMLPPSLGRLAARRGQSSLALVEVPETAKDHLPVSRRQTSDGAGGTPRAFQSELNVSCGNIPVKPRFYLPEDPLRAYGETIPMKLRYTRIGAIDPLLHIRNNMYLRRDDTPTFITRDELPSIPRLPVADECESPRMSPEQKRRFNQTLDNASQAMGAFPSDIQLKLCTEAAVKELSPLFRSGGQFVPYLEAQLKARIASASARLAQSSETPKEETVEDAQALEVDPEKSKGSVPEQPKNMTKANLPAAGSKQFRVKNLVKPNPIKRAQTQIRSVNGLSERENLLLEEAISEAVTAIGPSATSFHIKSCARAAAMKFCSTLGNHNRLSFFEISQRVRLAMDPSAVKTRVKTMGNVPQFRKQEIAANQGLKPDQMSGATHSELEATQSEQGNIDVLSGQPEIVANPQGLELSQKSDATNSELEATQSGQGNIDLLSRQQKLRIELLIKKAILTMLHAPARSEMSLSEEVYLGLDYSLRQHKWLLSLILVRLLLDRKGILAQTSDMTPTTQGVEELSAAEIYQMEQLIEKTVDDIGRPRTGHFIERLTAKVVIEFCKRANYKYNDWLPKEVHKRLTQAYSSRGLTNKRVNDGVQLPNGDNQGSLLVGKVAAEVDAVAQAPEELKFEVLPKDGQENPPVEEADTSIQIRKELTVNDGSFGQEKALVDTTLEGVDAVKEADAGVQISKKPAKETSTPSVDTPFRGKMRVPDKTVGDAEAGILNRSVDELSDEETRFLGKAVEGAIIGQGPLTKRGRRRFSVILDRLIAPSLGNPEGLFDMIRREVYVGSLLTRTSAIAFRREVFDTSSVEKVVDNNTLAIYRLENQQHLTSLLGAAADFFRSASQPRDAEHLLPEVLGRLEIAGKVHLYFSSYKNRGAPVPANTPGEGRSKERWENQRQLLDQYTKEAVAAMGVDPSRYQIMNHGARIAIKLWGSVGCGNSLIKEVYQRLQETKMVSHDGEQHSAAAPPVSEAMAMQQEANVEPLEEKSQYIRQAVEQAKMMFLRVGKHRSAATLRVDEAMSVQQADNLGSHEKQNPGMDWAVEQTKMVPQCVGEHDSAVISSVSEATAMQQTVNTESFKKRRQCMERAVEQAIQTMGLLRRFDRSYRRNVIRKLRKEFGYNDDNNQLLFSGVYQRLKEARNGQAKMIPQRVEEHHNAATSPVGEATSIQQTRNMESPEKLRQRMERAVEQAVQNMGPLLSVSQFDKYKMEVCSKLRRNLGFNDNDLFSLRVNGRLNEARKASLDRLWDKAVGRDRRKSNLRMASRAYTKSTGVMRYYEMSVSFARNAPLKISVLPMTPEGLLQEGGLWRKPDDGDQFLSHDNVIRHHRAVALREAIDRHLDGNAAKGYPDFWVDGSVTNDRTADGSAVVFCSDYSSSNSEQKWERWIYKGFTIPLKSNDSTWSELLAIAKAVEIAYTLPRPQEPDRRVVSIHTDCGNALDYLTGEGSSKGDQLRNVASQVVQGIKDFESQADVKVVLRWIPAHELIPGHAVADIIASRTMRIALEESNRASRTEEQQGTKKRGTTGDAASLTGINGRLKNLERIFQKMEVEKTALQTRASQLESENRLLKHLVLEKNKSTGGGQGGGMGYAARLKTFFFGR